MSDQVLKEAVAGFFLRHPDLALDRFGLPAERLTWLVPFRTVDAIAMLMRRWPRRDQDWHAISYFLSGRGDVSLVSDPGRTIIPSASVEGEIGQHVWEAPWESYVPIKPGRTKKVLREYQEFRRQWTEDGADVVVRRLVAWSFASLKAVPELMYGYRAHATEDAEKLRLEPFAKGEPFENVRKSDPWKL